MKNFKNQTIFIGRDPQRSQLLVAMNVGGKLKCAGVDNTLTISNSVSRLDLATKSAHCKIDIDDSGNMKITNLKDANVTYVDGTMVACKGITESSKIALGGDQYQINLRDIKKALEGLDDSVDISHLKKVWDTYQEDLEKISKVQQERNRRRMLPMLIGVGTTVVTGVLSTILPGNSSLVLGITLPIAIISFIICFKNYRQKDTSIEDRKKAKDWFTDNYVCPACKKFMGSEEYKLLAQRGKCPRCGAQFLQE